MEKKKITRRQFVETVSVGAGTILIGSSAAKFFPAETGNSLSPFQKVELGRSGLKTTILGMGTGFNGYNRSSAITRAGVAESMIRYAYDKGIRFFDCADAYGTHKYLAPALKEIPRESFTLGTKMWVTSGGIPDEDKADADVVVERFRKELDTEYIDLVQLHCLTTENWPDLHKKQMDILENLKSKGIIRAHGVSVHSFEALKTAVNTPWVDVIHVRINPFGDSMDKSDPSLIVPVINQLHNSGKGVIGMKLIGNGKFKDDSAKVDQSLKFVMDLGTVDMIIVGFEKPEQIDNYISRFEKIQKT